MTIKRYEGQFVHEVIERIRAEIGPDAVVLHTHWRNPAGLKKLLGRPSVEVWAAEPDAATEPAPARSSVPAAAPSPSRALALRRSLAAAEPPHDEFLFGDDLDAPPAAKRPSRRLEMVEDDVQSAIRRLEGKVDSLHRRSDQAPGGGRRAALLAAGVEPDVADGVLAAAAEQTVAEVLCQALEVAPEWPRPRTVALVGPAGAGKTTVAAKLAAWFGLSEGRRVLLVTADTQRVGALEQFRAYGELMMLPTAVCHGADELARTLTEARDQFDLIVIDTPAAGPDEASAARLAELLTGAGVDEIHAVLPAVWRGGDVRRAVAALAARLPLTAALVTKLDETAKPGVLIDLAWRDGLPISFLADGPQVPGALRRPTRESLVELTWSSRLASSTEVRDALPMA